MTPVVHTTGVNWESIITILVGVSVLVTFITGWIGKTITASVERLGERLELKLESKEKVNAIEKRVVVLEQKDKDKDRGI